MKPSSIAILSMFLLVLGGLSGGCGEPPASARDHDAGVEIADDGGALAPPDGGDPVADAGADPGDAGSDGGLVDPPDHVTDLGPGLATFPIGPITIVDTRGGGGAGVCGALRGLGVASATLKVDLANCDGLALPPGTRAVALSVTVLPLEPAPVEVRVGPSRLAIGPGAPSTHHAIARLGGTWLTIASDGGKADVVVELTAAFAPEAVGAARVRFLPEPMRAYSTVPGETAPFSAPLALGSDRTIAIADLALEPLGIAPHEVMGIVGVVHVASVGSCDEKPFELAIGPARVAGGPGTLARVAHCATDTQPWSEGVVVGTHEGGLTLRLDGAEAHVTLEVIGFLTRKWGGAARMYLPERTIHAAIDLGEGPEGAARVDLPVAGVIAVAGSAHAWVAEPSSLELRGMDSAQGSAISLSPDRTDVAWVPAFIGAGDKVAIEGSAPMRVELEIDALFANE